MSSGLTAVRLRHRALPERDLAAVSLRTRLLGRDLQAPLVIATPSAGTEQAAAASAELARAAAGHGVALVTADLPPDSERPPLLLARLGAAQVRGRDGLWQAAELVERLDADGLIIHLNPLQEAVQREGRTEFSGVADGIAAVVGHIAPRPVVVKEVGFGLDFEDVAMLREAGVAAVDVAGSGGTNWALVEGRRDERAGAVASAFDGWGVSTVDSLVDARAAAPGLPLIASGGLRDGVDVAKCIALGASAGGIARPLLIAAQAGRAHEALGTVVEQLRIATWLCGAGHAQELGREHVR